MNSLHDFCLLVLECLGDASVRSLVLAVLAALAAARIRRPAVRHAIWTMVLLSMPLLPVAQALLPPLPLIRVQEVKPALQPVRVVQVEPSLWMLVSERGVRYSQPPARQPLWPVIAVCLYLAVLFAMLIRFVAGWVVARRLVAASATVRDCTMLDDVAARLRLPYPLPRVYESDRLRVPIALNGEIVLPADWRAWDASKLRAVLAHELTHIRRGDWPLTLLAALNTCVFWFHPLAWWLERRLATLSEQACDDDAMLQTGDGARYAEVLLEFAAAGQRLRFPALAMARGRMGRRIERAIGTVTPAAGVLHGITWIAVAVCAIPVVAMLSAVSQAQPPKPDPRNVGGKWQYDAIQTSPADAEKLEASLARDPDDLEARGRLIGYYVYNLRQDDADRHVLWLIEHHPGSELAGSAPAVGKYSLTEPVHEQKKKLWLEQAARHPSDARVLGNAGLYFAEREHVTALDLLKRALAIQPDVLQWRILVQTLYTMAAYEFFRNQVESPSLGPRLSPSDAARIKEDLDRLTDPQLLGNVGRMLSMPRGSAPPEAAEMFRRGEIYGQELLSRAQALDPSGNWLQPMRPGVTPPAAVPTVPAAMAISPRDLESLAVEKKPPVYPPLAQQARIQGAVRVQVILGADGQVKRVVAINGHPLLVPAAMEAVRSWVFKPYLLAGKPVDVTAEASVDFRLPR